MQFIFVLLYINYCIIFHTNSSFHGGIFELNAKFGLELLLYSLSHFECDSHTVHIHTQGHLLPTLTGIMNHHCSHMCIPVYSPWLPGYIDIAQTILVILTMGTFSGQTLCVCIYTYMYVYVYLCIHVNICISLKQEDQSVPITTSIKNIFSLMGNSPKKVIHPRRLIL